MRIADAKTTLGAFFLAPGYPCPNWWPFVVPVAIVRLSVFGSLWEVNRPPFRFPVALSREGGQVVEG